MRLLSCLMAVAIVMVFLLPSTIAIYAAVNGTAWDLQDLQVAPVLELLASAAMFTLASFAAQVLSLLHPEVKHPVAVPVPLFELDCALIC